MRLLGIVFLVLVLIGAAMSVFERDEQLAAARDMCADDSYAWVISQRFIKERLRAPSEAEFPPEPDKHVYGGNCTHAIFGYVDAENAYGATVRQKFDLTVKYDQATKSWSAEGINMR